MLTRGEIEGALEEWHKAWESHDLDGVMDLFHDKIYFENWTGGRVRGKDALREAWTPWFRDHGGFRFTHEDLMVDETQQKAVTRWRLDWPSREEGYEGRQETRWGVDIISFRDGKIVEKLTYSKTTVEIEGKRVHLTPQN
ncbi:MAG: nuclear transport factor 2 family protein [Candidatus Bathyarchaeota archaeon]|jgi:ketosteroid isomerase-like protein